MKKLIALVLSLILVLSLAACGGNRATPTEAPTQAPTEAPTEAPAAYTGTLTELVTAIYEKQPLEFSVADPMAIDLADSYQLSYFMGLTDGSKVSEAVYSEPFIGSQPYSMVAVRVKDAADASAVAEEMRGGIDTRKWVCVEADDLHVGAYGDVVLLVMVGSELAPGLSEKLMDAFASVVGAELDYKN